MNATTSSNRALYRAWSDTIDTAQADVPARRQHPLSAGTWIAAAPMLAVFALTISAALVAGGTAKGEAALPHSKEMPIAGGQQMRRHAEAVQAFASQRYASAYGRFAALADEGDAPSALMALAMVRHGAALFRSEWSATPAQLQRWSALALDDVRERATQVAEHGRGE